MNTTSRSAFQPLDGRSYPEYRSRIESIPADTVPQWGQLDPAGLFQHLRRFTELALQPDPAARPLPWPIRSLVKALFMARIAFPKSSATLPVLRVVHVHKVEEERQLLLASLDRLVQEINTNPGARRMHPFFGMIPMREWAVLNGKHLQHHLVQFGV